MRWSRRVVGRLLISVFTIIIIVIEFVVIVQIRLGSCGILRQLKQV